MNHTDNKNCLPVAEALVYHSEGQIHYVEIERQRQKIGSWMNLSIGQSNQARTPVPMCLELKSPEETSISLPGATTVTRWFLR